MSWTRPRLEPDPRRWSLATRLTLYLSVAMGGLLVAVAWMMNAQLEHQLHEKDEIELAHALATQRDLLHALPAGALETWPAAWRQHLQPAADMAVRVLAEDGRVVSESPAMAVPAAAFRIPAGRRFVLWRPRADGPSWLLAQDGVEVAPGRRWTVQVAADLAQGHALLEAFHQRLRTVVAAAALAALLAGWWLVRRGLRPLRAMSAEIERVGAQRLDARIGDRAWPADLQALAGRFDAMLARLEASFERLARFSSDLAHEFRSPITNLVAAASVTLRRPRTAAEYEEVLDVVVNEGDRLSRMVSAMLFLARADDARQAVAPETLSIATEFATLAETFEAVAEERGLRIEARGEGTVIADPLLLRRALANLVANALAHTPAGGRIVLAAPPASGEVRLAVADTGSGIATEHLPHLFDRFYRVDAARSSSESTGLGLAIVKSIAELHGGRVEVASEPGLGSTFTVVLPMPGAADDAARHPERG